MQKILVIQTAFIGDVVLATAVLEKLHLVYPDVKLDFLVRKGNDGLLKGHPFINELLVWDKTKSKYPHLWQMLKTIRRNRYDVVVNIQRFAATGFLTTFSGAKMTIGFDKNPWSVFFSKRIKHVISTPDQPLHEVNRNQSLIEPLTGDLIPVKPRLYPTDTDYAKVQSLQSNPYIVIAPASVWFTKQYPVAKWVELIDQLPRDYKIYIIGAPTDKSLAEAIYSGVQQKDKLQSLCGELSLLQSAALQEKAVMNYVNDSAPMHFASALNAPVTAVYCSTLPSFGFGPLSDRSYVVETKESLDCRPCGLHGQASCPKQHFNCANTIKVAQLLETLQAS